MDAYLLFCLDQVVFTSQQTYQLMHCIERIALDHRLKMAESKEKKKDI